MLRPYTLYISKLTMDMLRAQQQLMGKEISRDEIADQLLQESLKDLPLIQELMELRRKSESAFERDRAELVKQLKP